MRHSYAAALANSRRWLEDRMEGSLGKTIPPLEAAYVVSTHTHRVCTCAQQTFLIAGGVWTVADNVMLITIFLLNKYPLACAHSYERLEAGWRESLLLHTKPINKENWWINLEQILKQQLFFYFLKDRLWRFRGSEN